MKKIDLKIIFILFLVLLIAAGLRLHIAQYDNLFEYDAYFHARMTEDLIKFGQVFNPDELAYYQEGGAPQTFTSTFWIISAVIYNSMFGWNVGFDLELFTKFMQVLPAICGVLICFVIYFVGKAMFDNKYVGLVMAFIAATMPAFVYRTMGGAQGDNAFGFLPFTLGLLFILWSTKTDYDKNGWSKRILYSVLAAICFCFMISAWSMHLIVLIILIPWFLATMLFSEKDKRLNLVSFTIPIVLYIAFATLYMNLDIFSMIAAFSGVNVFIILCGSVTKLALAGAFAVNIIDFKKETRAIIEIAFIIGCFVAFIGLCGYFLTVSDIVDRTTLGSMVGEESLGHIFFESKYSIFLFAPFLLLLLTPIVLFLLNKSQAKEKRSMIFLCFMITILFLFMAWYKLKFTFVLGFGMIFVAGFFAYITSIALTKFRATHLFESQFVFYVGLFFLFCSLLAGSMFILDYVPSVDADPAFKETIEWITLNTPQDAKLFNSWGDGHVLSYLTGRKVSSDNRNYSARANALFGEWINTDDVNRGYEIATKDVNCDYILLKVNDFYSFRTNEFYIANKIDYGVGQKFEEPFINIVDCISDGVNLNCGDSGSLNIATHLNWTDKPSDFYSGTYQLFMYAIGNKVVVLNVAGNNSNLAKVLTSAPETRSMYELVFSNNSYKVLKVIR